MDNIIKYPDWKVYRFQCDCTSAGCCLDLEIDAEKQTDPPLFLVSVNQSSSKSLWRRIKWAFKYIFKGEDVCLGDIVLRDEDRKELIRVLSDVD